MSGLWGPLNLKISWLMAAITALFSFGLSFTPSSILFFVLFLFDDSSPWMTVSMNFCFNLVSHSCLDCFREALESLSPTFSRPELFTDSSMILSWLELIPDSWRVSVFSSSFEPLTSNTGSALIFFFGVEVVGAWDDPLASDLFFLLKLWIFRIYTDKSGLTL